MFNLEYQELGGGTYLIQNGPTVLKMARKTYGTRQGPVGIAWIIQELHALEERLASYNGPCGPDDMIGDSIDALKGELCENGVNPWAIKDFTGYRHDSEFASRMWEEHSYEYINY